MAAKGHEKAKPQPRAVGVLRIMVEANRGMANPQFTYAIASACGLCANRRSMRDFLKWSSSYITGTTTRVSSVELARPPITTTASPLEMTLPPPTPAVCTIDIMQY